MASSLLSGIARLAGFGLSEEDPVPPVPPAAAVQPAGSPPPPVADLHFGFAPGPLERAIDELELPRPFGGRALIREIDAIDLDLDDDDDDETTRRVAEFAARVTAALDLDDVKALTAGALTLRNAVMYDSSDDEADDAGANSQTITTAVVALIATNMALLLAGANVRKLYDLNSVEDGRVSLATVDAAVSLAPATIDELTAGLSGTALAAMCDFFTDLLHIVGDVGADGDQAARLRALGAALVERCDAIRAIEMEQFTATFHLLAKKDD